MRNKLNLFIAMLFAVVLTAGCGPKSSKSDTTAARKAKIEQALKTPKAKALIKKLEDSQKAILIAAARKDGKTLQEEEAVTMARALCKIVIDGLVEEAAKDLSFGKLSESKKRETNQKMLLELREKGISDRDAQQYTESFVGIIALIAEAAGGTK